MSFYSNFTIEQANDIGTKFKARCRFSDGYKNQLTVGKEYEITIVERILPTSPLCEFMGDNGKLSAGHLTRFERIERIETERG
jgi:hypothetical protein